METLLKTFSITEICLYTVLLLIAFKEVISFFNWLINWNTGFIATKYQKPKELEDTVQKMARLLDDLTKKVDMLISSDKDDIKAFITRQHHDFCHHKGWIDDYSLDCIERRYSHYKDEGGNSFINILMQEIRALPKQKFK